MTDLLPPHLIDDLADAIARRVVEQLTGDRATEPALIDATEVARRFGVTRSFVYDNAGRFGARRLGNGTRARLRFDPATVAAALTDTTTTPASTAQPRRRRRHADHTVNGAPLLEVKARAA